eukprot:TRINITY_DN5635_c2_g1_i3.p4 TRINITY_DN5635_c2_g1~~TRINITY_DN5635_c2_g1_i3.p4  ORF type:complete len:114 (+),score=10.90 TRINITY_DN5635_c2_g1_i3:498-839(+)
MKLLEENGGLMNLANLMTVMGASHSSPFGNSKLNQMIIECKFVTIKGGAVFIPLVPKTDDSSYSLNEINCSVEAKDLHVNNIQIQPHNTEVYTTCDRQAGLLFSHSEISNLSE